MWWCAESQTSSTQTRRWKVHRVNSYRHAACSGLQARNKSRFHESNVVKTVTSLMQTTHSIFISGLAWKAPCWILHVFQELFKQQRQLNVVPEEVKLKSNKRNNDAHCVLSKQANTRWISLKRVTITLLVYIALWTYPWGKMLARMGFY